MHKQVLTLATAFGLLMSGALPARAGEADVVAATATPDGGGLWSFSVTVKHADEGWEHYADRFEVVGPDGKVLGVRTLAHPHETEQPFTRSLGGVAIPDSVKSVIIRAGDSVHELGGKQLELALPR